MRDAVILDFDGTLCDVRGVGWTLNRNEWHARTLDCPPIADVVTAASRAFYAGAALVIATAREWHYLSFTASWLEANLPVPVASIYMRRNGDYRPHAVVKREMLDAIRADGYFPVRAFEDRLDCARMYEEAGIPVTVPPRSPIAPAPAPVDTAADDDQGVASAGSLASTGWRARGVSSTGVLRRAFWHTLGPDGGTGWIQAGCGRGHPAPAPDRWCGLHVITSETEMWEFVRRRFVPGRSGRTAVGAVEYDGVARWSLVSGDPPSTLRVERARVIGPVVVLLGAEALAPLIRERYGGAGGRPAAARAAPGAVR